MVRHTATRAPQHDGEGENVMESIDAMRAERNGEP
jgi:hypothetical protein